MKKGIIVISNRNPFVTVKKPRRAERIEFVPRVHGKVVEVKGKTVHVATLTGEIVIDKEHFWGTMGNE